jgi:arylsulfatase A-like enzyme
MDNSKGTTVNCHKKIKKLAGLAETVLVMFFLFATLMVRSQNRPNILLIISDDLNTRIGPYMEIDKHTPNLDRLATEGVRFSNAYCQYPLCGPSRASIMSGLYPETNGVLGNNDQPGSYKKETPSLANHPSMTGFFREQGYFTARVSKIYHMGVPGGIERGEPGGDEPDSWDYACNVMGPETLSPGILELLSPKNLHYGSNFARMILADSLKYYQTDYVATNQAISILENRAGKLPDAGGNKQKLKPDAPFFLAVGLVRPHVPLIAPESCFKPYPVKEATLPPVKIGENVPEEALRRRNEKVWGMNEEQKRKTISAYMASVRFMDEQVGRLLNTLDRLDLREETIVVFLSDHGYNLGEHDCWSKVSLWEGSVRVPLIISVPGYKNTSGSTCKSVIELIDLYPTLTELCDYSEIQPKILQGTSLVKYLENNRLSADKGAFTISYGGKDATLIWKNWRYNRWGEDVAINNEELYDHVSDPEESVNLATNPELKKIITEMRERFEEARKKARMTPGS